MERGGIHVGYAMPKGGKVTDDVADKVIALQKPRNKYMRFPKGLSDDDTGVFRMAVRERCHSPGDWYQ